MVRDSIEGYIEKVPKLTTKEINTVAVGAHLAMRTGAYELASELYSILKIGDDEIKARVLYWRRRHQRRRAMSLLLLVVAVVGIALIHLHA